MEKSTLFDTIEDLNPTELDWVGNESLDDILQNNGLDAWLGSFTTNSDPCSASDSSLSSPERALGTDDIVDYVLSSEDSPLSNEDVNYDVLCSEESPPPAPPSWSLEDHDYVKAPENEIVVQSVVQDIKPKYITILPAQSKTKIALITSDKGQKVLSTTSTTMVEPAAKKRKIVRKGRTYPALILTEEEKQLCDKDGIVLPSHYPLTKLEEANLKKIRRKIRNKLSAQSSRKRKKEYVDDMEARALASESENAELKRKVSVLESQNRTLITQLKRMQSLVMGKASGQKSATALMVLLLSTALFAIPGFKDQYGGLSPLQTTDVKSKGKQEYTPRQSRSLLQYLGDIKNDDMTNIVKKIEDYDVDKQVEKDTMNYINEAVAKSFESNKHLVASVAEDAARHVAKQVETNRTNPVTTRVKSFNIE